MTMAELFLVLALTITTLFQFLIPSFSSSAPQISNVLNRGSSLSVENHNADILVSPNGLFTAGFHPVGDNAYCFAVWFSDQVEPGARTVVWMANRDQPVNGKLSRLSLWKDGNLVLTDAGQYIIWSTQTKSTSVRLQLEGTGNLVLDGGGHPLWQSFEYPTDTLLPDQPFTKDTMLVSSKSSTNFYSGFYKLFFDTDSVLRLRYDGPLTTTVFWPDPGLRTWEVGRFQYMYTRNATLDPAVEFNSSDGFGFLSADFGIGPHRIMRVDVDGNLRVYSLIEHQRRNKWRVQWQAVAHPCRVHGICGPNSLCTYSKGAGRRCTCLHGYKMVNSRDWSYGCEPRFELCKPGDHEGFVELRFVEFYGYDIRYHQNITLDACKSDCLQDCACKGFQFGYDDDKGNYYCYIKTLLLNGYQMGFYNSMYIKLSTTFVSSFRQKTFTNTSLGCPGPVARPMIRSYEKKHDIGALRFMLVVGCVVGLIEIVFIVFFWYNSSNYSQKTTQSYFAVETTFKRFTYCELKKASSDFREEIGRGGASVVYKGRLSDNRIAAIKKLKWISHQGEAEFQREISTIGRLNHMNLIETWGYCVEGKNRLLVFEYMENGSLAESMRLGRLAWDTRFAIATGTAKGLAYLHEECLEWVLHCDVKPHNILLDAEYNPKLADFGLSKLYDRGWSTHKSNFSKMRGTRGYMAPEWVFNLQITSKVDVYSYGVVILEMITGRSPAEVALVDWVRERICVEFHGVQTETWIEGIVDPAVSGEYDRRAMENLVKIALQCVEEDREARPTMSQVLNMLLHPENDR